MTCWLVCSVVYEFYSTYFDWFSLGVVVLLQFAKLWVWICCLISATTTLTNDIQSYQVSFWSNNSNHPNKNPSNTWSPHFPYRWISAACPIKDFTKLRSASAFTSASLSSMALLGELKIDLPEIWRLHISISKKVGPTIENSKTKHESCHIPPIIQYHVAVKRTKTWFPLSTIGIFLRGSLLHIILISSICRGIGTLPQEDSPLQPLTVDPLVLSPWCKATLSASTKCSRPKSCSASWIWAAVAALQKQSQVQDG